MRRRHRATPVCKFCANRMRAVLHNEPHRVLLVRVVADLMLGPCRYENKVASRKLVDVQLVLKPFLDADGAGAGDAVHDGVLPGKVRLEPDDLDRVRR